jgi:hypothetical protein
MKFVSHMTDSAGELQAAAEAIDPAALQATKDAIAASCQEYIRWADLFSRRLETLPDEKLHQFARAFALTLMGQLPTRPGTCPFCIQYGRDRACDGCGYAATHGRCDSEDSAFSVFIEAFQELGRVIYQDTGEIGCSAQQARQKLYSCIKASARRALQMESALDCANTCDLMQLKADYIRAMVELIPAPLLSQEVALRLQTVKKALGNYW